MSKVIRLL